MKKLLTLLLLVCSTAYAEKWMEMPNEAGGKIILLAGECNNSRGKMVIATTPSGTNINGCWYYFAEMIHIVWQGGKTSSFNPNDFVYKESK
jgi:hypothetical protein